MLSEIASTGTEINSTPSVALLGNLFFNKAPLHDGACIIREGRILSAGCILPLTDNNRLSSALGTRHRAAIGMSEQSDAVVVIVSEETGFISVAINGKLQRDVQTGRLREILLSELITENHKNDVLNKFTRGEKGDNK